MALESVTPRLLSWPPTSGTAAEPRGPARASEWRGVVSVLAAADELAACHELSTMARRAVELARESVGLERVALYVQDPASSRILRGTYGTGASGETTDERGLSHECGTADWDALLQVHALRARWLYYDQAPHIAQQPGSSVVIGHGWLVMTPLVSQGEIVGVMYNDAALSHSVMDEGKQVRLAVFCSLLANLIHTRRGRAGWQSAPSEGERTPVVRRVLDALNQNVLVGARSLASEMSISPGHLTRVFRTEMGVSLVEYRNRLRIERFFSLVERGGDNLLAAALAAGFGSYAQFHRVFRKVVGTTPREYIVGRRTLPPPAFADSDRESAE
jgi:AraC-like DNA-binding protein